MVFRLINEQKETSDASNFENAGDGDGSSSSSSMASSTLKPHQKPLHNFPLQDLKWSLNPTNGHHHHRVRNPNSSSLKSPNRDTTANSHGCDPVVNNAKSEMKLDNSDKKSKIFIRIRTKSSNSKCTDDDAVADTGDNTSPVVMDDAEETLTKTWNLRPRKTMTNTPPVNNNNNNNNGNGGGVLKIGAAASQEIKSQEPSRIELTRPQRNGNSNATSKKEKQKEKKVKFSISLTKEEIEEDVYALTGSKPARRPKKRAKHVQKQLDYLFPGLWLASVTPDVYRILDAPRKG
ncbi:putative uncharacterized protein DDB_G0285119 [Ricinus communis]|uniref:putative uncharacterized protein DDB_G0285119 n=1 Tax=Ricinus communis TaxID=3988 RepID=UPI00201AB139|nr:putative uncharacterized protein DDB_G0285119 [Ricinus communis]